MNEREPKPVRTNAWLVWLLSWLLPKGHQVTRIKRGLRYSVFGLTLFSLQFRWFSFDNTLVVGVLREDQLDVNRIIKLGIPLIVQVQIGVNAKHSNKYGLTEVNIGLTRFLLCRRWSDFRENVAPSMLYYFELKSLLPKYVYNEEIIKEYDPKIDEVATIHAIARFKQRKWMPWTKLEILYVAEMEGHPPYEKPVEQRLPRIPKREQERFIDTVNRRNIKFLFNVGEDF